MFQSNTLYTAAGVGLVLVDVFMVGIMMSTAFKKRWNRNIMQSAEKIEEFCIQNYEKDRMHRPLIDDHLGFGAEARGGNEQPSPGEGEEAKERSDVDVVEGSESLPCAPSTLNVLTLTQSS